MSSLRWVADGIAVAEACGGVTLERRRGTGFATGADVRQRPQRDLHLQGFEIEVDPDPYEDDAA